MSYILIESNDDLTSQERAELITRELYNITAPEAMQHDYQADGTVFGLVEHPDGGDWACLLYTSPSPRDATLSRMPSSA